ncbi:MAG: AAA family ATPase [Micrococcaceae bacterium]
MIKRSMKTQVLEALKYFRIVYLQGARQVGKSTLVKEIKNEIPNSMYVTLDDPEELERANSDPKFFINQNPEGLLIIDEVQLAPDLWRIMKMKVDDDNRPGQLLLTLSSYKAPDSLAGRVVRLTLDPLSESEINNSEPKLENLLESNDADFRDILEYKSAFKQQDYFFPMVRGGYPEVVTANNFTAAQVNLISYLESLIEKDQETFASYKPKEQLIKALNLLAVGTGQEFVKANCARDMDISMPAAAEYLDVFSNLFLVYSLPAWSTNDINRVIKKAKIVFNDSGLVSAIENMTPERLEADRAKH